MTSPTLGRWKEGCSHVWMVQRLRPAKCAKCGTLRSLVELKEALK